MVIYRTTQKQVRSTANNTYSGSAVQCGGVWSRPDMDVKVGIKAVIAKEFAEKVKGGSKKPPLFLSTFLGTDIIVAYSAGHASASELLAYVPCHRYGDIVGM